MAKGSTTWNRVKFGDVVRLAKETCKDPVAAGIERVIGLEHLEPGDLRVRSWADIAGGTTFTTRVRPGQVLFGKRRAYQRKVAVADFDAVCSGDIYVFESTNPERLLPDLLPFICQTDAFFEHAVGTSAGSLSPRTNWSSLAGHELDLPSREGQRRLADLLLQSRRVLDALRDAIVAARRLYDSALSHFFVRGERGLGIAPSAWATVGWSIKRLGDVGDPDAPISYGIVQPGLSTPGGVPTATSNNLNIGFSTGIHLTAPTIEAAYARSRIRGGDVLVTVKGFGTGNIGRVPQHFSGNITRDVARIRLMRGDDASYLMHLWKCHAFERYWRAVSVGTTRPELSIGKLRDMELPWPSEATRDLIVERLAALEGAVSAHEDRLQRALHSHSSLLRTTLAPSHARGAA